jgi:hypothetical protein
MTRVTPQWLAMVATLVVRLDNLRNRVGKAVKKDRLRQHGRARDLLMDALDSAGVSVSGDEDDRCLAYLSKPPSGLDPFAASFEINVHQDNVGLIFHCTQKGFLSVCR